MQAECEVVVGLLGDGRESRQGWQGRTDEIGKTLRQRTVFKVAPEFRLGKVTVEGDIVQLVSETGGDEQIVEMIGCVLIRHREVADLQGALGII